MYADDTSALIRLAQAAADCLRATMETFRTLRAGRPVETAAALDTMGRTTAGAHAFVTCSVEVLRVRASRRRPAPPSRVAGATVVPFPKPA